MDVLCAALVACLIPKILEIVNAVRWLNRRGEEFRVALAQETAERGKPLDERDHHRIATGLGGDFFPYGYKDLRLERTRLGKLFRNTLGRLPLITGFGALVAVVGLSVAKAAPEVLLVVSSSCFTWLLYAMSMGLLVCSVLIAIEATYGFATLGGYAVPFHARRPRTQTRSARLLLELRYVGLAALLATLAATSAVFVVSSGLDGFAGMPPVSSGAEGLGHLFARLLDALYFVVSTLATVGYGDVHATSNAGKGLVILLDLGFFLLVTATLLSFSLASHENTDSSRSHKAG